LRENRPEEAEKAFEAAVKLKPDYALPHYELGKLLAKEKQFVAAARELEEAVEFAPDLAGAYYQLSRVYESAGQAEKAESALAQFQKLKTSEKAEGQELAEDVTRLLQLQ